MYKVTVNLITLSDTHTHTHTHTHMHTPHHTHTHTHPHTYTYTHIHTHTPHTLTHTHAHTTHAGTPHTHARTHHTHSHAPQSVGFLWTSDQLDAETSEHTTLTQHSHATGAIPTRNTGQLAAADPNFRPRGHHDQFYKNFHQTIKLDNLCCR